MNTANVKEYSTILELYKLQNQCSITGVHIYYFIVIYTYSIE